MGCESAETAEAMPMRRAWRRGAGGKAQDTRLLGRMGLSSEGLLIHDGALGFILWPMVCKFSLFVHLF